MLTFYPLYWIYHDCWKFQETYSDGKNSTPVDFFHAGHIHFFMMDYNPLEHASQKAYTGTQTYKFEIKDVWGPNSTDSNQVRSYKLVGSPRWYFYIEEYWRRVYIQNWDIEAYTESYPNHPGRLGIKYDASLDCHSLGPFREGGGLYFFNTELNRTLPVEYWLNTDKTIRQHFLRKSHYTWDTTTGSQTWDYGSPKPEWQRRSRGSEYWQGDNVVYTDNYYMPSGHNTKADIVLKADSTNTPCYYRYMMISSNPVASRGENYWPNPTPGADEATLRGEYLDYFDFNGGWNWKSQYHTAYNRWIERNGGDSQTNFETFLNTYPEDSDLEYYSDSEKASCAGMTYLSIFKMNCFDSSGTTLKYEYIDFKTFCTLWEKLSRGEIESNRIYGDYPVQRENVAIPEEGDTSFSSGEDPFHDENLQEINPYERYLDFFETREDYTIPRGATATGDKSSQGHPRESSYTDEDGARKFYPDNLYLTPVIEYKKVVQLNYERLPERASAEANIDVWTDSGAFGDGFSVSINIPYTVNGIIQSPFSDDAGTVYPPGNYFHGITDEEKLRYSVESYGDTLTENASEDGTLNSMKTKVEKYSRSAYKEFYPSEGAKSDAELIAWLNENYANRPILFNPEEGCFDSNGIWIEPTTYDRPTEAQVEHDSDGNPLVQGAVVAYQTNGLKEDGIWVEQCLGAKVLPKVELIFEDTLGHRWAEWVDSSSIEATSATEFVGIS